MKRNDNYFDYSYEVDRRLLSLFDIITSLQCSYTYPDKYNKLLRQLEFELSSDLFHGPRYDTSLCVVDQKLTITDYYTEDRITN